MSNTVRLARSITLFIFMLVFTLSLVSAATQYIGTTGANQSIGNNNEIFIDNTNGRVGIGDTSPDYALDVVGDSYITGSLVVNDGSGGVTPAMTVIGGNGGNFTFGQPGSGTTEFIIDTASWSHIKRLSFGSLWDIQTQYGGDNLIFDASPQSGNSQVLVLDDDGFVGIRMDPVYNLDVNGSINTNTNLCIDGACISDWSALNTTNIAADSIDGTELADSITLDADLNIDSNTFFIDESEDAVGFGTTWTDADHSITLAQDLGFASGVNSGVIHPGAVTWGWGNDYEPSWRTGGIEHAISGSDKSFNRISIGTLRMSNAGSHGAITYTPTNGNGLFEQIANGTSRFIYASSATSTPIIGAVIDAQNQRVGIGTDSPDYTLDVNGPAAIDDTLTLNPDGGTDGILTTGGITLRLTSSLGIIGFNKGGTRFAEFNGHNGYNFLTASTTIGGADYTPDYTLNVLGDINADTSLCIAGDCISSWSAVNTTTIAADSIGPTELADTWNLDAELDIDGNDFDVDSGTLFVDDSKNLVTFDGGSGAAYASTAGSEAISISGDVRFTGGLSQGTSSGGLLWTWGSLNINYGAIDFFLGNNTHGARMISGMLSASAGFNNPVTYTPLAGNSAVEVTEENEVRFLYAGSVTTSPTVAAVVDTANSRLGIGTHSPTEALEVSDGTNSLTVNPAGINASPTINTTNSKDLYITSGGGNVIIQLS